MLNIILAIILIITATIMMVFDPPEEAPIATILIPAAFVTSAGALLSSLVAQWYFG